MSLETDVVDAQIEAYRARDIERFLSHYAEDASVVMFDGTVMLDGRAAMREQYGKLFANNPDLQITIASRMAAGEFVVDEEHLSGSRFTDGQAFRTAVAIYRVTGGKIAKLMLLR